MSNEGEWTLTYTPFGLVQYPDGTKAVMAWNEAEAKRLVEWHNAALAAERDSYTNALERCEICNSELSQCGAQGIDGEPSLDCLVCKLREQLNAERRIKEAEKLILLEEVAKNKQLQQQLEEMTKDRDRWRDMAHGGTTTRPAWN